MDANKLLFTWLIQKYTRIWANAQRDGRPAEYRWRPQFNAARFGWRPLLECRAVTSNAAKTRHRLKCAGVPQTGKPISAVRGPKFTILWGLVEEILLFNKIFSIVDMCLSCEDTARQIVWWWPYVQFLAVFCILYFQRAACSTFQTCILNSH